MDGTESATLVTVPPLVEAFESGTPLTVKRTKRSEADLGESNARLVEVEIKPDDPHSIPQMLGREARVIFQ